MSRAGRQAGVAATPTRPRAQLSAGGADLSGGADVSGARMSANGRRQQVADVGMARASAGLESVAQLAEQPVVGWRDLPGRPLLAARRGERPKQLLLLGVESGGGADVDVHDDVAAAGPTQVGHPQALERDR